VAYHRSLGLMDRERDADGRRRHLPHLLHDQAHRLGGAHAALRAGHVPAARPGAPLHPRVAHPAGRRGRGRRLGQAGQARAAHEHARRADAHDRPARRRCSPATRSTPPSTRPARAAPGDDARGHHGAPGRAPAEVPPRARTGTTGSRPTSWAAWSRSSRACASTTTCGRRSSSRWAWSTPGSSSPRVGPAWPPATSTARPTPPPHGRPVRQPLPAPALLPLGSRAGWSRPPTTTWPSARCWPTAASSTAGGSSGARRSS
jgi:hypothetical protein